MFLPTLKLFSICGVSLLLPSLATAAPILGDATYFNVFAFGDLSSNSDINGRVAVGGSLGTLLTVSGNEVQRFDPFAYTTIVNGSTNGNRIQQNTGGDVFARGAATNNITIQNGTGQKITSGASPIDFASLQTQLLAYSDFLGGLSAYLPTLGATQNDDVVINASAIDNIGADAQIFRLTTDQFGRLDKINTGGKTIVIDVVGTNLLSPTTAFFVDGQQATAGSWAASKILFNFHSAADLEFRSSFYGAVLAPNATLTGNHQINGQFIVNAVRYNGQIHGTPFMGDIPVSPVPEPGTMAIGCAGIGLIWVLKRRRDSCSSAQRTQA